MWCGSNVTFPLSLTDCLYVKCCDDDDDGHHSDLVILYTVIIHVCILFDFRFFYNFMCIT